MAVAAGNLGRPAHVDRNRWRLYCVVIIDGEPPASRPVSQAPVMRFSQRLSRQHLVLE
jgi:hypothetical protein